MEGTAFWIAIWGALLSTVLGIIKIIDFFRDRSCISVEVKFASIQKGSFLYSTPYKILPYVALIARNTGRRTIVLTHAGFRLSNQRDLSLIPYRGEFPKEVKEGAEHTVLFDVKALKQGFKEEHADSIKFAWFRDGANRIYKRKLASIVKQAMAE